MIAVPPQQGVGLLSTAIGIFGNECILLFFRMDVDQSARTNAQEYFGVKDPDYYEFEGRWRSD